MASMNSLTEQPARRKAKAPRRKAVGSAPRAVESVVRVSGVLLSGQALLDDMDAYRRQVTASPEAAQSFLKRLGVLTKGGKTKTLIRG
jgi:transcriptional regulator of met regulon